MKLLLLLALCSFHLMAQDPTKLPNGESRTQVMEPETTQLAEEGYAKPIEELTAVEETSEKPVTEKLEEATSEVKKEMNGTSFNRQNSLGTLLVGIEPISTWVPLKFTASYTHIFNEKWSLEGEYGRGKFGAGALGFDVASIKENRFSLLGRRYIGNSFHWILGLYKDDLTVKLGSDILDSMSNTSIDEVSVDVLGGTLGIGNRWQWSNGFTLGMDWVRINIPVTRSTDEGSLKYISDNSDYDAVNEGLDRVASIPTFVLFGLYLGYTF